MARHRAFISYSHADARFASRLQRDIENFRVPAATVARLQLDTDRLTPIFRDTSDLPAAGRLTDALTEALSESEALIVVCSDAGAHSNWVNQEIQAYLELHGEHANVLPVISPDAGKEPAEHYLPELLVAAQPLAADARTRGQGHRGALLRIVAGLLHTGLDELIQRDARRRYHRALVATAAFAIIAVCMGILALQAISSRTDAERRLSQSEDLIGFMLGELREQLTPLGQVRVLKSIGDKALEYFASLNATDQTDVARLRKSRALYQLGDVYFELGEFAAARRSFRLSLELARALAAEKPGDAERLFELGQAEFWTAYAAWYEGDLSLAEIHFNAYHDAAWSLHRLDPDNPDWIMETFWASNNLGSLTYRQGDFPSAQRHFEEAIARIDMLLAETPTEARRREKAATLSWLGSTHFSLGEPERARQVFSEALASRFDPTSALDQEDRAFQLAKLAEVDWFLGDLEAARLHATEAASISEALSQADPESKERLWATTIHRQLMFLYAEAPTGAADFKVLSENADTLLASDAPPPPWHNLALRVGALGIRHGQYGALTRARELLDSPDLRAATGDGTEPHRLTLATMLAEQDPDAAHRVFEEIQAVAVRYATSHDMQLAVPLLRARLLLEEGGRVRELQAELKAVGANHPDMNLPLMHETDQPDKRP